MPKISSLFYQINEEVTNSKIKEKKKPTYNRGELFSQKIGNFIYSETIVLFNYQKNNSHFVISKYCYSLFVKLQSIVLGNKSRIGSN